MPRREASDYEQESFLPDIDTRPKKEAPHLRRLHEGLAPYLDVPSLRRIIGERGDIYQALRSPEPPTEVRVILDILSDILRPRPREQIKSPADIAAILMLEMGPLPQEELRTVLLDTKNRVMGIYTIYKGSLNTAMIRVGEVFRPAIHHNSAAIVVAHNHPSQDCTPSPEDVLVTRAIVEAGQLLDIDCLDHLVVSMDRYVSMREKGLGFNR